MQQDGKYGGNGRRNQRTGRKGSGSTGGMGVQEALNAAIDYCVEHGILYETLREHRAEVLGMLLEEGIETGKQQGSQMTLIRNVDLLMKNFNVALPDACAALETSVEEYEAAKNRAALWKESQN